MGYKEYYINERITDIVFYHATDKSNLNNIEKEGLKIGKNPSKAQIASSYEAVKKAYLKPNSVILQIVFNKDIEREKYLKFKGNIVTHGVEKNNDYSIKETIPFKFIKVMKTVI